ncbi:MAG: bifunctional phosphopantothenoylcysteine decarboxylase/phosphopantothenate--cysteine ligase CoaBC [Synechococcales cyanobacterium CRU_2_2]|nr:bifunctional phosphopantothenoylcysteine decarboxylase/phosphopantothenate--cysteine ligase CoaBC [Synechococcales cyanobacterium CRU_2_2]
MPSVWQGRRFLLAVGGGIAAYKLCEIASTLGKAGADVQAVLTESAQRFVTPLSFSTLCRRTALTDADFWVAQGRPLHIELGEWAELIVLAPLTANTLAKLAYGLADNLLTNTVLASTCPVLLAPAMNTDMWQQVSVQRNWALVLEDPRFHGIGPGAGLLACDRLGPGRMAEPDLILAHLQSLLHSGGQRDLVGKRILISAGGTREFLDSVRFIGNPSTGRMGLALAQAAQHRGAQVTLVHGPMTAPLPMNQGTRAIAVTTADEMQTVLKAQLAQQDWVIMAAAVADVRPAVCSDRKLPKAELPQLLPLAPVPDLIADLVQHKAPHQKIVGFAAQTGDIVTSALAKLQRKGLDAIVANPVDLPDRGFGSALNQGMVFDRQGGQWAIDPCTKLEMAHRIYDIVARL